MIRYRPKGNEGIHTRMYVAVLFKTVKTWGEMSINRKWVIHGIDTYGILHRKKKG